MIQDGDKKEYPTKAGFIAVVGKPNAGKSSFLNWIIGEKLSIVSKKANATRKRSNIIAMHKNTQLIFVDTPGLHETERTLNKFMLDEALKAIGDCDLILFLSPVNDDIENYKKFITLNKKNIPHFILLTKTDTVSNEKLLKKIEEYKKFQENFISLIPISIKKGVTQTEILDVISKKLPNHPYFYDPEILTTQNIKDIYKEFVRESIFEKTSEEIPYFADVIIEKVEEGVNIEKVFATIVCDKSSQKGIIIGKDGQTLKRIGKYARELIENVCGKKVFLKLFVAAKPGWTRDKKLLEEIGYKVADR